MNRRETLAALAAMSVGPVGCSFLGGTTEPLPGSGATPLAPAARMPGAPVTIDAHAHFFNATDVTPEGYLKYSVAHSLEHRPELQKLVRAAAPVLGEIARELPLSAREELEWLASYTGSADKASAAGIGEGLRRERQTYIEQQLAPQIVKRVPNSDFERAYRDATATRVKTASISGRPEVDLRSVESVSRLLGRRDTMSRQLLGRASSLTESAEGDLEFAFRMLMPRWINLMDFIDACSNAAPGVDGAISALVDFDDWMDHETARSPIEDQIQVQELLCRLSGGFTLPLVPFNPLKDPEKSLALVREAISKRGFVGVKIYPPMGFGADGSHALGPNDLRRRMNDLFSLMEELDAVVMAHGGHSMGRNDAYDAYAGPSHWQAAMKAGHTNLRVNIGHFGGSLDAWAAQFARDMATYPNLYADLGYREELILDEGERRRFADLFKAAPVARRAMYGSDFFMMTRLDGWQAYAARMMESLQLVLDPQTVSQVRGQNAIACFGLLDTAPNSNGARLAAWRGKAPLPRWAQA